MMKTAIHSWLTGAMLSMLTLAVPLAGHTQTKAEFDELKAELRALQQKTDQLEKKLAAAETKPAPATKNQSVAKSNPPMARTADAQEAESMTNTTEKPISTTRLPILQADEDGFGIRSFDDQFTLHLGGYVQADGRFYQEPSGKNNFTDTFLLRRVRPILEGTVYKDFHFFLMPDFGGANVVIQDAFLEYTHYKEVQFRVGKFREPVGLEVLQSAKDLLFVEFGLTLNVEPIRDVGAMLDGQLFKGVLSYQLGIFNGATDNTSDDIDNNDAKDVAARLWLQPFKLTDIASLKGLGLGIAGTYGEENGTLPEYRTPGQEVAFHYNSTSSADGDRYRIAPQFDYYWGPVGVMGEFTLTNEEIRNATNFGRIENSAWQIETSCVLTGEDASYTGVKPKHHLGTGGFGAVQLAARYGELHVDGEAFRLGLADSQTSVRAEKSFEIGVNWYLNNNVKAVLDWEHTFFDGGAVNGDRDRENAFLTRFQIAL